MGMGEGRVSGGKRHRHARMRGATVVVAAMALCLMGTASQYAAADIVYGNGGEVLVSGVPTYRWWSGCAPTSGGMIIGYWNNPALRPFYDGDATVWQGASYSSNPDNNQPYGTAAMVGSWDHVREGQLAGYNTSVGRGKWSPWLRDANCIADFMGVDDGGASANGVRYGLVSFAAWDNPDTTEVNESVSATTELYYTFGDPDPWSILTAEIDASRPSIVLLRSGTSGHAVAGYGYIDSPGSGTDYVAVRDTWGGGLTGGEPPGAYIDDGVEWWPWNPTWSSYGEDEWPPLAYDVPLDLADPAYGSINWTVDAVVTFYADPVPEPGTMALVALGIGALVRRLRRRRKSA